MPDSTAGRMPSDKELSASKVAEGVENATQAQADGAKDPSGFLPGW